MPLNMFLLGNCDLPLPPVVHQYFRRSQFRDTRARDHYQSVVNLHQSIQTYSPITSIHLYTSQTALKPNLQLIPIVPTILILLLFPPPRLLIAQNPAILSEPHPPQHPRIDQKFLEPDGPERIRITQSLEALYSCHLFPIDERHQTRQYTDSQPIHQERSLVHINPYESGLGVLRCQQLQVGI